MIYKHIIIDTIKGYLKLKSMLLNMLCRKFSKIIFALYMSINFFKYIVTKRCGPLPKRVL